MPTKYALGLLTAITLTASVALAQQGTTPAPAPALPAEPLAPAFSFSSMEAGFLGYMPKTSAEKIWDATICMTVRGVGVTQIVKDSPAEKAGLRKDDVILRIDDENVTSVRKLNRLVSEIAPDQSVRVVISRGGSEQELTATIGKRESMNTVQNLITQYPDLKDWHGSFPNADEGVMLSMSNRRIGVSTMELTKQLADFFGIGAGKGVLVTSVSADSPAAKAGIRAGDVITAVDGEKVEASGDISRAINRKKDGDVVLTIIRNKSQQTIQVTPKDGDFLFGTQGTRPQIGRRIVIPRIELPSIPEMNIMVPRIDLPTIPAINIQLPRVTRRVGVGKPAPRPI